MPLTLYKRGGIWHYRGTIAGRRLRGTTSAANKDTAAIIAAKIEAAEWKRHTHGPEAVLTFAKAAMLYRAAEKQTRFLPPIEDHWRDTLVRAITPGAIKQSAITLFPSASGATRNRQVIVPTQAIINHAAESGLCQKISVPRFPFTSKIKTPVTQEWVDSFMAHASPHLGALALFMFATGARISEALSLQWGDVNLQKRTALIRQTKIGAERIAELPTPLVVAMANLPRIKGRGVFKYVSKSTTDKVWRSAVKRAGIEPLSFHSCRHGFATALLHAGIDVVTIAKLGGWKSAQHVLQTYGHARNAQGIAESVFGTSLTQAKVARRGIRLKTKGKRHARG
jgi:integrase